MSSIVNRQTSLGLALGLLVPLAGAGCSNQLEITVAGKGQVEVHGLEEPQVCNTPSCVYEIGSGDKVTLRAAQTSKEHLFQTWSGDCAGTDPACPIVVDEPKTVKATFTKQFKLTVKVKGDGKVLSEDGKISCPGESCEASYPGGTEVSFRRQAGKDVFQKFTGPCQGKECVFKVNKDVELGAVFSVPAGSIMASGPVSAAAEGERLMAIAFDAQGGFAVASQVKKTTHVTRFDPEAKKLWSVSKKTRPAALPPAVGFFGDDVVVAVPGDKGTTLMRLAPDGKTERYMRKHAGCLGLTSMRVGADAVFLAGAFEMAGSTCGDRELISSGGADIVVARFAVEDGGLTWVTQIGSPADDTFFGLVLASNEDSWIAYNKGKKVGRLVRLNPAGKAYPEIKFGLSDETQVLGLHLTPAKTVRANGHVFSTVDFGGGVSLGTNAKDGAGRVVVVELDADGRLKDSALVARSRCADSWVCAFEAAGGFARTNLDATDDDDEALDPDARRRKRKKKKKKKKSAGSIRAPIHRLGVDGAERWSLRLKGSGFFTPTSLTFGPEDTIYLLGVLEGELSANRTGRVSTRSPTAVFFKIRD